jgi:hypothetical protein
MSAKSTATMVTRTPRSAAQRRARSTMTLASLTTLASSRLAASLETQWLSRNIDLEDPPRLRSQVRSPRLGALYGVSIT